MGELDAPIFDLEVDAPALPMHGRWPARVELILSALAAGEHRGITRRHCRRPYRTIARLHLFSDPQESAAHLLYTRDVSRKGLGFITSDRLPLGHGGQVQLIDPSGLSLHMDCTLSRCRETASGWFEGALHFNRDQPRFDGR